MIKIMYKPVRFFAADEEDHRDDEELKDSGVEGVDDKTCLENLVTAINIGEIDDTNNELIIISDETSNVQGT